MLAAGEQWSTTFTVTPRAAQPGVVFRARIARVGLEEIGAVKSAELEKWLGSAPRLEAQEPVLARTYRASLSDLAALRLRPDLAERATLPAAGLPWLATHMTPGVPVTITP